MKTKLLCLVGRHKWLRLATQPNGIGFLDQCEHCGRGRYLLWIGHASTVGKLSSAEMEKRLAESDLPPHLAAGPLASAIARGLTHEEHERQFYGARSSSQREAAGKADGKPDGQAENH